MHSSSSPSHHHHQQHPQLSPSTGPTTRAQALQQQQQQMLMQQAAAAGGSHAEAAAATNAAVAALAVLKKQRAQIISSAAEMAGGSSTGGMTAGDKENSLPASMLHPAAALAKARALAPATAPYLNPVAGASNGLLGSPSAHSGSSSSSLRPAGMPATIVMAAQTAYSGSAGTHVGGLSAGSAGPISSRSASSMNAAVAASSRFAAGSKLSSAFGVVEGLDAGASSAASYAAGHDGMPLEDAGAPPALPGSASSSAARGPGGIASAYSQVGSIGEGTGSVGGVYSETQLRQLLRNAQNATAAASAGMGQKLGGTALSPASGAGASSTSPASGSASAGRRLSQLAVGSAGAAAAVPAAMAAAAPAAGSSLTAMAAASSSSSSAAASHSAGAGAGADRLNDTLSAICSAFSSALTAQRASSGSPSSGVAAGDMDLELPAGRAGSSSSSSPFGGQQSPLRGAASSTGSSSSGGTLGQLACQSLRSAKVPGYLPSLLKGPVPSRLSPSHSDSPKIWVTEWVDFTEKYGFAYLLSNGTVGVNFNDSTKIVQAADGETFQYMERAAGGRAAPSYNTEGFAVVVGRQDGVYRLVATLSNHPAALKKKVYLLKHFRAFLLEHLEKRIKRCDTAALAAGAAGERAAAEKESFTVNSLFAAMHPPVPKEGGAEASKNGVHANGGVMVPVGADEMTAMPIHGRTAVPPWVHMADAGSYFARGVDPAMLFAAYGSGSSGAAAAGGAGGVAGAGAAGTAAGPASASWLYSGSLNPEHLPPGLDPQLACMPLVYVKKYARTRRGLIFRLSNRVAQASFHDATSMVLAEEGRVAAYTDRTGERHIYSTRSLLGGGALLTALAGQSPETVFSGSPAHTMALHSLMNHPSSTLSVLPEMSRRLRYLVDVLYQIASGNATAVVPAGVGSHGGSSAGGAGAAGGAATSGSSPSADGERVPGC